MIDASIVRVHQHGVGAKGGNYFRRYDCHEEALITKILAIVDALVSPLKYEMTVGNINDCVTGYELFHNMELEGKHVVADRGYDTNKIIDLLQEKQAIAVIPSKKKRSVHRETDRRLATRYDKLACLFLAFVHE